MASFGSVVLFACMLVFTYHVSGGEAHNFWGQRRVRIINDLCNKTLLTIDCKSDDADIGRHVLIFQGWFEWRFYINWLPLTLFRCRMQWADQNHMVDVFRQERDELKCRKKCWWSIRKDGGYMFDERKNDYDMLVKW